MLKVKRWGKGDRVDHITADFGTKCPYLAIELNALRAKSFPLGCDGKIGGFIEEVG